MAGQYSINIPTKPYLKKYIQSLYGNPVVFTSENYFGITVSGLLARPLNQGKPKEVLQFRCWDKFTDKLTVFMPLRFIKDKRYGHSIEEEGIISINKLFEERFEEDLYRFCFMYCILSIDIKDALEEFCRTYGIDIEVDISYEALKKKEYRFRKNLQKTSEQVSPKKSQQLSVLAF